VTLSWSFIQHKRYVSTTVIY